MKLPKKNNFNHVHIYNISHYSLFCRHYHALCKDRFDTLMFADSNMRWCTSNVPPISEEFG
jgi:hypothetical protein